MDQGSNYLCWFCKKNPTGPDDLLEVPLTKILQKSTSNAGSRMSTSTRYITTEVNIPCCDVCWETDHKTGVITKAAIWVVTLGMCPISVAVMNGDLFPHLDPGLALVLMIAIYLGLILVAPLYLPRWNFEHRGIPPLSTKSNHPDVKKLLDDGWKIGKQPGSFEKDK